MDGMSEVRTSADPFRDTPKQGCFTIAATIAFMIIMLPVMAVVELYHKYDESCAKRACRPENCIVATITELNGVVQEELPLLCEGHLEGPVITIQDDGQFSDTSFYKVDQDFPWESRWPRPRFVRRHAPFDEPHDVYIYAIFGKPDPKQKTKEWWLENGYDEYGLRGRFVKDRSSETGETFIGSQAYSQFIGKSRGRLYDVDFAYDKEYPPTYLLEAATKQTDKRHVRNWVKAHQDLGE